MYQVGFISKRVKKEFSEFSKQEQRAMEEAIAELGLNPRPLSRKYEQLLCYTEIKKIKVGRIRVFYKIDEKNNQIWIGKLDNRDSHTYKTDPKSWFQRSA
ncbi:MULTISPECIES: type II toxin-antitoxin system RelE/ParE family toxin [unclassified Paenibacillus]|uniref:type II toxin-antitoxin system RelE family toxin n=1 Tax=unclassified Paenibacillus TaxID=185978 RepID=UPI00278204DB|nr:MULTISPECIES: hypothetical protein [unclassified Paenibacillus]MDQ0896223.1 mRNA-degrading endonuclease RelE of RelBE toxin-antitoxin system [Paenibacillus sp. V4I7]MDQ0913961.1 mRNA-degrading endonuclease RelE of RelBE toxin-antitoxin system [Paenibacillus sp. V4I5]